MDVDKQIRYWEESADVIKAVRKYLEILRKEGFLIEKAMLFGSHARGSAHEDSDIDLLLVSPLFDKHDVWLMGKAWSLTRFADPRIEPVMVGSHQFSKGDNLPLVDIIKKEGIEISIAA